MQKKSSKNWPANWNRLPKSTCCGRMLLIWWRRWRPRFNKHSLSLLNNNGSFRWKWVKWKRRGVKWKKISLFVIVIRIRMEVWIKREVTLVRSEMTLRVRILISRKCLLRILTTSWINLQKSRLIIWQMLFTWLSLSLGYSALSILPKFSTFYSKVGTSTFSALRAFTTQRATKSCKS